MVLVVVFFIRKNYLPPKADNVVFLRQAPLTKLFTFLSFHFNKSIYYNSIANDNIESESTTLKLKPKA